MEYRILRCSGAGRHLLLDYATKSKHPLGLRRQAVEQLRETIAGIELLLGAAKTPRLSPPLAEAVGGDPTKAFKLSEAKLKRRNSVDLWTDLINGLSASILQPTTPITSFPLKTQKQLRKQLTELGQQNAKLSLKCLVVLTGRTDLKTQKEWSLWQSQTSPGAVTQRRILQLVLDLPDLWFTPGIARRLVPWQLGRMPPDCMSLYKEMVHNDHPPTRYYAAQSLLFLSDNLEAVPVVIDIIEDSPRTLHEQNGAVELLQQRFGVNFFWDKTAWRNWWERFKKAREKSTRDMLK